MECKALCKARSEYEMSDNTKNKIKLKLLNHNAVKNNTPIFSSIEEHLKYKEPSQSLLTVTIVPTVPRGCKHYVGGQMLR